MSKLIVVDIQPEYEDNATFDIGDILRSAVEDYSSVLFLFNGEDTLGMISEGALKDYYFEKLDYDEEMYDELLSKSEFFDKGYGFFRDVMDSNACFDRNQIVKIVKYMLDNDIQDIRDLSEEDVEVIGVNELLFDDLEDYGFHIPDLSEVLPNWSGSALVGGARNECMAEVEILGAAQGLTFNHIDEFIYEGEKRYSEDEALTETSLRSYIRELLAEATSSPCTNASVRAIATYFGDEDKLPHPDDEVCDGFTNGIDVHMTLTRELGYKSVNITTWWQRSAMEGWRPTLKKFIAEHPEGVYYIWTKGHAMALIDGKLTDTMEFRRLGNVILISGEKIEK